jgi:hypothetical protein
MKRGTLIAPAIAHGLIGWKIVKIRIKKFREKTLTESYKNKIK